MCLLKSDFLVNFASINRWNEVKIRGRLSTHLTKCAYKRNRVCNSTTVTVIGLLWNMSRIWNKSSRWYIDHHLDRCSALNTFQKPNIDYFPKRFVKNGTVNRHFVSLAKKIRQKHAHTEKICRKCRESSVMAQIVQKRVYMYYKYIAMPSPHSAHVRRADLGGTITLHPVTPWVASSTRAKFPLPRTCPSIT